MRARARGAIALCVLACAAIASRSMARAMACPAVCAHRLRVDDDGDGAVANAVARARALARRGIACADVDVSLVDGAYVVAHPSEIGDGGGEATAAETFAAFAGAKTRREVWMSFELKGDASRPEGYAAIDAAAREVGARAFAFTDYDWASAEWRAKRTAFERLLRGRRPVVEFAWAARDVEDFAVNVSNVDARRMRKLGGARVAFPSIKMTRAWFAEASRQKIDVIPWIVDDEESARKALSVGAKAVISNVPLRMRRILDEMCEERRRGKF